MFCHKCGNKMPEDARFCQKCGAKLIGDDIIQQTPAETVSTASPEPAAESTDVAPTSTNLMEPTLVNGEISDLEFLGYRFEVTEEFKKLNAVRSGEERKYYDLCRHSREVKRILEDEVRSITASEVQKFSESLKRQARTPKEVSVAGYKLLEDYLYKVVPEYGRQVIFKHSDNDAINADEIAQKLEFRTSGFLEDLYNIIDSDNYNPNNVNTNVDVAEIHSTIDSAFYTLFGELNNVCAEIVDKELDRKLDKLDRESYKELGKDHEEAIEAKVNNYRKAYEKGDISAEKFVAKLFEFLNDDPYNMSSYCELYCVATNMGDNDAQERIVKFTKYIGLDGVVTSVLDAYEKAGLLKRPQSKAANGEIQLQPIGISDSETELVLNDTSEVVRVFEFLGSSFNITKNFDNYISIRREQEIKATELMEHCNKASEKMQEELLRFVKPETDNYSAFVNKLPQDLVKMSEAGFTELQRYRNDVLAKIGKRLIFKYTKNDSVSVGAIAANLEIDAEKHFSNFIDKVGRIEEMQQSFQSQREYSRLTRRDPSMIGIGFGFKGAIGAAVGSAVANTGASIIAGIGEGIVKGMDNSKVQKETDKVMVELKKAFALAYADLVQQLHDICNGMLYDDLNAEIKILGIKPYKVLSEFQSQNINTKLENYDEAYSKGDIEREKYVSHIFNVLHEISHGVTNYYRLYKVAGAIGDKDAQERIISFTQYLGLEERLKLIILKDISQQSENSLEDIEKKLSLMSGLSDASIDAEVERLKKLRHSKIEDMPEDNLKAIEKKLSLMSGLSDVSIDTEVERLKKQHHCIKHGVIAVGDGVNYEEYTAQKNGAVHRNGMPFTGHMKIEFPNGLAYEGHFKDGQCSGQGMILKKGNIVYKGEFLNGKKHGRGVFTDDDRTIFEGCFTNDLIDSKKDVTIKFSNGDTFSGRLFEYKPPKFGKMSGTVTYADGSKYTGELNDLQPHGKGELAVSGEKKKYKGTWRDGALRTFRPIKFILNVIGIVIGLLILIAVVGFFAPWTLGLLLFNPLVTIIVLACIAVWYLFDTNKDYTQGYSQRKAGVKGNQIVKNK